MLVTVLYILGATSLAVATGIVILQRIRSGSEARRATRASRTLRSTLTYLGISLIVSTFLVDSLIHEAEVAKTRVYQTGVPDGAIIYEGSHNGSQGWKKWKLGADCYLSRDLGTRSSAMAPTTCPKGL